MAPRSERDSRGRRYSRSPRDVSRGGIRRHSHDGARRHKRRRRELHDLRQENAELLRSLVHLERAQRGSERYDDELQEERRRCTIAERKLRSTEHRLSKRERELTKLRDELARVKEELAAAHMKQRGFEESVKERQEDLEAAVAAGESEKQYLRENLITKHTDALNLHEELVATRTNYANRTHELRKRFRDAEAAVEEHEDKRRLVERGEVIRDPIRGQLTKSSVSAMGVQTSAFYREQTSPAERPPSTIRRFLSAEVLEDELYEVYYVTLEMTRRREDTDLIRPSFIRAIGKCRENDITIPRHIYQLMVQISMPFSVGDDLERALSPSPEPHVGPMS